MNPTETPERNFPCPSCDNPMELVDTVFKADVPMNDGSKKPIAVPIKVQSCDNCQEQFQDHVASTAIENTILRVNIEHELASGTEWTYAYATDADHAVEVVDRFQYKEGDDTNGKRVKATGWCHAGTRAATEGRILLLFYRRKSTIKFYETGEITLDKKEEGTK